VDCFCICSQGEFYTVVEVPEGTHQYKYYVDGDWACHPNEVCHFVRYFIYTYCMWLKVKQD